MSTVVTAGTGKPATASSAWLQRFKRLRALGLLAIVLAIWQVVSTFVLDPSTAMLLPAPTAVAKAFWELILSGEL